MSFWSNPWKSVTNIFTNPVKAAGHIAEAALPIVGAIGGGIVGGPWGAAAGAELGGTGAGLLKGESLGQAALGALPGAALSGVGDFAYQGGFNDTLGSLGLGTTASTDAAAGTGTVAGYGADSSMSAADQQFAQDAARSAASTNVAAPGAVMGAATPPAAPGFIQSITGGHFGDALKAAGITPMQALGAAGLGATALKGSGKTGAEKSQAAIAGQEAGLGANQIALGQAGQLTPGLQAMYQQQMNDEITAIKSQYAQMGMSGSTSEQQAIGQARSKYAGQIAQAAQQEINTGLNALNMGGAANTALAQQQLQADQGLASSIAALAGMGGMAAGTQKQQPAA